jgi:hypothetical protein
MAIQKRDDSSLHSLRFMEWEFTTWACSDDLDLSRDWNELNNDSEESKPEIDSTSAQSIVQIPSPVPQIEQLKNSPLYPPPTVPIPVPVSIPIPLALIHTSQASNEFESPGTISAEACREMNDWILSHIKNPFLTKNEEDYFIIKFNLTRKQVKTAFNNRRQRMIGPRRIETQRRFQQHILTQLARLGIRFTMGSP